ncbi:replication protein [Acinetobacter pollinis]|uniref:Replication protein n=1 Tax=Acinetobacter pollinis TaxID=2605270 RepID=A0ABU6DTV7_9GAMM|nr:replication protein [Acinetobacter pollinis]MEB5477285.1 replication protein [Acinetobacter pollinis]
MNVAQKQEISQEEKIVKFPKKEQETMSKEEGYTKLPNMLIDDLVMAQLSDKAFKCLMLIVRQTIGFGKASDSISITQFQKHCGIKKRDTVIANIKELEALKVIQVIKKTGVINSYKLILNQYHEKVLVPSNGTSAIKRDGTSTVQREGTSPIKRDSTKENFKENIKKVVVDNNTPKFEPQNKTMLHFIEYYPSDFKSYSLKELCQIRSVESDFIAQAKTSFPNLSDEIIQCQFAELCQWSLTANKLTSQKWMSTWLRFLKNPKPSVSPITFTQPKPRQAQYNSRNVNDAWGEPKKYAPCNPNSNTEGDQ